MNSVISCAGLEKSYGSKKVLKGINLEVPPETIVALLGTNGAGKTTLIRTLLGLIPKTKGEVHVLGEEPYQFGPRLRQRIGYVSEEQGLYGWMKVREIIDFCKSLYPNWDDALVTHYLDRFEINPQTKIHTLSKGQQVKVALLLAIAPKPELLILDEPMSGLDPLAQNQFLQVIMKEIQDEGTTIFFSTHNLADALHIAQSVAIVFDGKIRAYGSISEVCDRIRRVEIDSQSDWLPKDAVLINEELSRKVLLVSSDAIRETAAASQSGLQASSPATLEEAFLYFCSGRERS
jgi:ABC-2 type transport system ATP-binding protein